MMGWKRILLLLCVFGFFRTFRPSDSFHFEYLTGPWKNFTMKEIYQEVTPVATYSHLATLLPVLLLTDFLRYKPVVMICGFTGCFAQIIMILGQSLWAMKVVQVLEGLTFSAEIAYFSYIYAEVGKQHYREVTSHTMTALLLGKFTAGVVAQLLLSFGVLDCGQLEYFTLIGTVLAMIWTFFLPSVSRSVYFDPKPVSDNEETLPQQAGSEIMKLKRSADQLYYFQLALDSENQEKTPTLSMKIKHEFHVLWSNFLIAYSQRHVLKWSAWWAFSVCGCLQVYIYIQVLWQTSLTEADNVYNGAIEASQTILSALATFGVGKLTVNWSVIGEAVLAVFALIQGMLLLLAAETYNIWFSYAAYVGFCVMYHAMITVARSEIAKKLPENSYGLIFGFNLVVALVLQSVITFTVSGSWGFALAIRPQYVVYGSYFIVMGAVFALMAIYTIANRCRSDKRLHL